MLRLLSINMYQKRSVSKIRLLKLIDTKWRDVYQLASGGDSKIGCFDSFFSEFE